MTLDEISAIIKERKETMPEGSYVASIFQEGQDRMIQKVGEEAIEVVIAAKNEDRETFKEETADLLFMLTILLTSKDMTWGDILSVLEKRKK